MPHLHTTPGHYDFTVSAYIVRTDGSQPVILMHKHKKLHMYLQFGGHIELHESPWSAITHETAEESGYGMDQLKLLQPPIAPLPISHGVPHPYPVANLSVRFGDQDHYHTDISYAFVTDQPPRGVLGAEESQDVQTFTAAQLAALPASDIPESVREISLYILQECLHNWTWVDCKAFSASNPL